MNTNIYGLNGYSAIVRGGHGDQQISWAFLVKEDYGTVFTVELAKKMLDFANTEYKKECPKGYYKPTYNPKIDFTYIKYDMTDYRLSGEDNWIPAGKRKIGIYDIEKNLLRIYIDGNPVYENYNGRICRDTVALMDSDADDIWK